MRHLYRNWAIDWFVAESAEQAAELARAHYLELGVDLEEMDLSFEQVPDDKLTTLRDGAAIVGVHPARTWAEREPLGHFATTND